MTWTELTAVELAAAIARREVSAREVVESHIARIEETQEALNAVVVPLFDQARAAAEAADAMQQRNEALGPLHGVPITIKDMFDVAGTPTTVGLLSNQQTRAATDAPLVQRLKRAGAIVLGKTNVPQLGMMIETDNPVYGRTNNPWALDRSPGGSSGGEAAILAVGGSALGLGSDGGGSIRLPAHYSGVCGFKPTTQRLTMQGHWRFHAFPDGFPQPGPLARSVADLDQAMQVLIGEPEDQPLLPPVPWRSYRDVEVSTLRIGYFLDEGGPSAAPGLRRAVKEAVVAMERRGAAVELFQPPDVDVAWRLFFAMVYADGGYFTKQAAAGTSVDWRIRQTMTIAKIPNPIRPLLRAGLRIAGQPRMAEAFRYVKRRFLRARDYLEVRGEMVEYCQQFERALDLQQLDVLLCPPTFGPALLHGKVYASYGSRRTVLFNLLGMPAGVVPATTVRNEEECDRPPTREFVEKEQREIELGSTGLPVAVQVAAGRWRDHHALAVMAALEAHFREQDGYPRTPIDVARNRAEAEMSTRGSA